MLAHLQIFVTVGTNEKHELLVSEFRSPPDRIFSFRNASFADAIQSATNSYCVNVVTNYLVGELLDELWRLTADGGIMV
jgi:hypothetical protein